jgi:hypothetical protein
MEDGGLQPSTGRVQKFRAWLVKQIHDFTISWIRRKFALRRYPKSGFRPAQALEALRATSPRPDDLEGFTERTVMAVTRVVIDRISKRSRRYAEVLWDLIRNHGVPSDNLPERLGVSAYRMADIRRRARDRFRDELVNLYRKCQFPADDMESLIRALSRLLGRRPRRRAM